MGLCTERFEPPVEVEFICVICLGVLDQPLALNCEHHFCRACITQYITTRNTCPVCRESIRREDLNPINRSLKNLLNKSTLHCRYQERGCDAIVVLEGMPRHESECAFTPSQCSNDGCRETLNRKDLPSHAVLCEWRTVTCVLGCQVLFKFRETESHQRICELFMLNCVNRCGVQVKRMDMDHHVNNDCGLVLVKCEMDGCDFSAFRNATEVWTKHDNDFAVMHCKLLNKQLKIQFSVIKDICDAFHKAQSELIQTRTILGNTQDELKNTKSLVGGLRTELNAAKTALSRTQTDSTRINSTLTKTKAELSESKGVLAKTRTELSESKEVIATTRAELGEIKEIATKTKAEIIDTKAALVRTQMDLTEVRQSFVKTPKKVVKEGITSETTAHAIWGSNDDHENELVLRLRPKSAPQQPVTKLPISQPQALTPRLPMPQRLAPQLPTPQPPQKPTAALNKVALPKSLTRVVVWNVTDVTSKRTAKVTLLSDELKFASNSVGVGQQFSFLLKMKFADDGSLKLYFVIRRGSVTAPLEWPLRNVVKLEIINTANRSHKVTLLNDSRSREYFQRHNPPNENNRDSKGCNGLTANEVNSGDYVKNDTLKVEVSLLSDLIPEV
eukprot:c611_g1_i1.p1 GENE.c611_g1_i1~~c611_g1_i1.p1  ORF type:complete len:616 (+),score=109.36 c611_g1_i1:29-1876(+)